MTATIGYARVSTGDQNTDLQMDALEAANCERVFTDHASGSKEDRPQLAACMDYLRAGDTLVVWKLDRLGRSVKHLLTVADDLYARGIALRILTGTLAGAYTPTGEGRFFFTVMAAFAELERAMIIERTRAGLAAARARGRVGGRKPSLTPRQAKLAREMYAEKGPDGKRAHTVADIARDLKVGRTTIYRYLEESA